MDFDEHNQPRHGHLEGGVRMDSVSGNRQMHGTSPTVELEFTKQGELRLAHLERGVEMHSEEVSQAAANEQLRQPQRLSRTWRSPVADVAFRDAGRWARAGGTGLDSRQRRRGDYGREPARQGGSCALAAGGR